MKHKLWKLLVIISLILFLSAFFLFRSRAHNQLLAAKQHIVQSFKKTRDFSIRENRSSSFYFANTLPASIHANYPGDENNPGGRWIELVAPENLWGARFRERVHINFDRDGKVKLFFCEKGGVQSPGPGHSIPDIILFNRTGEEVIFRISPSGDMEIVKK